MQQRTPKTGINIPRHFESNCIYVLNTAGTDERIHTTQNYAYHEICSDKRDKKGLLPLYMHKSKELHNHTYTWPDCPFLFVNGLVVGRSSLSPAIVKKLCTSQVLIPCTQTLSDSAYCNSTSDL